MKITVLSENKAVPGFENEHGLSIYVENKGKSYIIDCGASDAFLKNSAALNIDLSKVSTAILSHGHSAHVDGFIHFLEINSLCDIHARRSAMADYYYKDGDEMEYIGISKRMKMFYGDRFIYHKDTEEIEPGVWLIPHGEDYSERARLVNLYMKNGGEYTPDTFDHEYTAVFKTEKGLDVFSSCSHAGVDNILREVTDAFPMDRLYAFVGGFHLPFLEDSDEFEEEVLSIADTFADYDFEHIYIGHCTGDKAYEMIKNELPDSVHYLTLGSTFEI